MAIPIVTLRNRNTRMQMLEAFNFTGVLRARAAKTHCTRQHGGI